MKIFALPVAAIGVLLLTVPAFGGEPVTDLSELEWRIGSASAEHELGRDHPILGKAGTKVTRHGTTRWELGERFHYSEVVIEGNGQVVKALVFLTSVDPATKQVVSHWFGENGAYGKSYWYRDEENEQKWYAMYRGVGAEGLAISGVFVTERKSPDVTTAQYTRATMGGVPLPDSPVFTYRRNEERELPELNLAGEPAEELRDQEWTIGTQRADGELQQDHPVLGKAGTKTKMHRTRRWDMRKNLLIGESFIEANGKSVKNLLVVTNVDPRSKQVLDHWFAADGGRGTGYSYADEENPNKRYGMFSGMSGDGQQVAGMVVTERKGMDSVNQFVRMTIAGEALPDGEVVHWMRLNEKH